MATAIKQFSGSVGSTGGTSINWKNEDSDLDLCLNNTIDKAADFSSLLNSRDVAAISAKPDGSRIYITGVDTNPGLKSFDLATNWDIESSLSNHTSFDFFTPSGIATNGQYSTVWNNDGSQFLITSSDPQAMSYFTCSTPYDVSTASYSGAIEEFENSQSSFVAGTWADSGKTFIQGATSGTEYQVYTASTPYDFSSLEFNHEERINSWSINLLNDMALDSANNGLFGDDTSSVYLHVNDTSAYNNSVVRLRQNVSGYPATQRLVDNQIGAFSSSPAASTDYFEPNGNYLFFMDANGNYTSSYSSKWWLFRRPTFHTVAADQTIYTVPTGKVAKVTMNMAGQCANVYVDNDKIASFKGGSSIRHTQRGHIGYKIRDGVTTSSAPTVAQQKTPCTTFFARGGTSLDLSIYNDEGPAYFLLEAGESLILKNSVNVNFDIQVIEDNASS